VAVGIAAGGWLGAQLTELYNLYFRFPVLYYRLSANLVLAAVAVSLVAATLGAFSAVRRAVAIPPAEAMRPEPPARYRRSVIEQPWVRRHLPAAVSMVLRNIERHPFRAATSVLGIGFGGGILLMAFALVDAMEQLIETQFSLTERQDVSVTFMEPASPATVHALRRLPGVMQVEPQRVVPARLRVGHRHRNLAVTGVPADPELRRIVDRTGRALTLPPDGLVISAMLARILDIAPGGEVTVEVLEGRQPVRRVPLVRVVDDTLGLAAYMELGAVRRLMREGATLSGAALLVDRAREAQLSARLKALPAVAGVAFKRLVVESFRETLAQNMGLTIGTTLVFAGIIASGVVYNAARVSLSERSRELASLRVLGFTRGEISAILLGELAILTLASLPIGAALGQGLARLLVWSVESEVYRFPFLLTPQAMAWSALTVLGASVGSGLIVRRHLDRLDLVGVLKIRE
jgi:putative ABC transport system permease protein